MVSRNFCSDTRCSAMKLATGVLLRRRNSASLRAASYSRWTPLIIRPSRISRLTRRQIHIGGQPEIALDDGGDRQTRPAAVALKQLDLDHVADLDLEDFRQRVAERDAAFRQPDRLEVRPQHPAQVGVPAACR